MNYECEDVSASEVAARLRQGGLSILIYYAVYRTEALATSGGKIAEIDFSDLVLQETYHAMRTLTLGKVRTNKATITYYSQIGTSMTADPSRDWVRHLLRSRLTSEVQDFVKRISSAAIAEGADEAETDEQVRTLIESHFRNFLSMNYGPVMQAKNVSFGKSGPDSVKYWQSRPRFSVGRKLRRRDLETGECRCFGGRFETHARRIRSDQRYVVAGSIHGLCRSVFRNAAHRQQPNLALAWL